MKIPASRASAARKGDSATREPSSSSSARHKEPSAQRPRPTSNNFLMTVQRPARPRVPVPSSFLRLDQQPVAAPLLGDQEARHHAVGLYLLPELAHQDAQILHILDMGG